MRGDKFYGITEIFYSIQGEGIKAGTPAVFVRFAGCNLDCDFIKGPKSPGGWKCDTDFGLREKLTGNEIVERCLSIMNDQTRLVIFTGGEPALQLDEALIKKFRAIGNLVLAIETNGTINVDHLNLDWICVSPKVPSSDIRQLQANEVKYVISNGDPIPDTLISATHYLLSPAFDGDAAMRPNIDHCVALAMAHPRWRVSLQQHKILQVR